jgi:hypothetical protein
MVSSLRHHRAEKEQHPTRRQPVWDVARSFYQYHDTVARGPTMSEVSQEAGKPAGGTAKHRGAKPPGGAKKPADKSARIQLHLGEQTAKRLNVHAALVGRNSSRVADEILSGWLGRFGKGREIFSDPVDGEVSGDAE